MIFIMTLKKSEQKAITDRQNDLIYRKSIALGMLSQHATTAEVTRATGLDAQALGRLTRNPGMYSPIVSKFINLGERSQLIRLTNKARIASELYLDRVLAGDEKFGASVSRIGDAAFDQLRLLEGKSTQIVDVKSLKLSIEARGLRIAALRKTIELKRGDDGVMAVSAKPGRREQ